MGFIKTILITVLVIIGGCTVAVGGCAIGVTKASVSAIHSMSDVVTQSHFSKLYEDSPVKAERLYREIAGDCYEKTMRRALGATVPDRVLRKELILIFSKFELSAAVTRVKSNIWKIDVSNLMQKLLSLLKIDGRVLR